MISRLDRYVARYYVSSWCVSAVFFVGLYGVYDLFAHFDDLLEGLDQDLLSAGDVGLMYALQMPSIFLMVAPFVMVMAAIITLLRLQRHNEFMAMILTGRSARRVMRPLFLLTLVLLGGLVWVQEVAAPRVALERDDLRWSLLHPGKERVIESVKLRDAEDRLFVAHDFLVTRGTIARLSVSYKDDLERSIHVTGEYAEYDPEAGGWRFERGTTSVREASGKDVSMQDAFFVSTDVRPEELLAESREPFDLSYADVLGLSERYPGSRRYRLLRHYHVTFPLSVLLLVLLAGPLVVHLEPSRRVRGLGLAILACLGFLILDATLRDLGSRGSMQPVLAAWLPVIVAGSLATVLFDALE